MRHIHKSVTSQTTKNTRTTSAQTNLAPLSTSCTEGTSYPTQGTGRCSNNDTVRDHANEALQRLLHAAVTRPCKSWGDSGALAFARAPRNSAVSSDHRPPTLPARVCPLLRSARHLGEPHLSWLLRSDAPCHHHAEETPKWCPLQAELRATLQNETVNDDLDSELEPPSLSGGVSANVHDGKREWQLGDNPGAVRSSL